MSALEGKLLQAASVIRKKSTAAAGDAFKAAREVGGETETRRSGPLEDAVKYVSSVVVSAGTRSVACRVVCNSRLQSNCLE